MAQKRELDIGLLSLQPTEIDALHEFEQEIRARFPKQIRQFALFGSKARGDSQEDSDLDVLVIIAADDREVRAGIIDIASDLSLRHDVLISPRVIGAARWEAQREFLIFQQIREDVIHVQ